MKSRAHILTIAVALTAVPLLLVDPAPASAGHSWSNYHWRRTSGEANLTLVDSVTSAWQAEYDRARTEWAQSSVLALASENGGESQGVRRRCAAASGQVRVCNAAYGFNGWLGLAQIWVWSDGHIAQGVAKMNDSYAMRPAEQQYVVCQEVGHTFGLGHQDENHDNRNVGSCMDYSRYPEGGMHLVGGSSIDYGPSNESPNMDTVPGGTGEQHGDFEQLLTIYSHLESAGAAPPTRDRGRSEEAGNTPDEWGQPIRFDPEGRPILYRRDRPDGVRLFTWVIWARGHGRERESD